MPILLDSELTPEDLKQIRANQAWYKKAQRILREDVARRREEQKLWEDEQKKG